MRPQDDVRPHDRLTLPGVRSYAALRETKRGKELSEAISRWGFSTVDEEAFVYLMSVENAGLFSDFTNKKVIKVFHSLKSELGLGSISPDGTRRDLDMWQAVHVLKNCERPRLPLLVEQAEFAREHFPERFRNGGIDFRDFVKLASSNAWSDKGSGPGPTGIERNSAILKEVYGVGPEHAGEFLINHPGHSGFSEGLTDRFTVEKYRKFAAALRVSEQGEAEPKLKLAALDWALQVKGEREETAAVQLLSKISTVNMPPRFVSYFGRMTDSATRSIFQEPGFKDFICAVGPVLFPDGEYMEVFQTVRGYPFVKEDPALLKALFSPALACAVKLVDELAPIPVDKTWRNGTILRLARDFAADPDLEPRLRSIVSRLGADGKDLTPPHLIMLANFSRSEELTGLLFNRDELLRRLEPLGSIKRFPRQRNDLAETLKDRADLYASNNGAYQELATAAREAARQGTTRSPDLKQLPNFILLPILLCFESLQAKPDPSFGVTRGGDLLKWDAARDLASDAAFEDPEHGGVLRFTRRGVRLQPIPSQSDKQDHYVLHPFGYLLQMGFATYHNHAKVIDMQTMTGPSGWRIGGDYRTAVDFGTLSFLQSSTGYPEDASGRKDKSQLTWNSDLYFHYRKEVWTVDFGKQQGAIPPGIPEAKGPLGRMFSRNPKEKID